MIQTFVMKGSYVLIIKIEKNIIIKIGKLGKLNFEKGFYLYVGSALNGLEQRIKRHLKNDKKYHWHIDYLLRYGKIINIFLKENNNKEECIISQKLNKDYPSIKDFGCSDCKCKSHLYKITLNKISQKMKNLGMMLYYSNTKY